MPRPGTPQGEGKVPVPTRAPAVAGNRDHDVLTHEHLPPAGGPRRAAGNASHTPKAISPAPGEGLRAMEERPIPSHYRTRLAHTHWHASKHASGVARRCATARRLMLALERKQAPAGSQARFACLHCPTRKPSQARFHRKRVLRAREQ